MIAGMRAGAGRDWTRAANSGQFGPFSIPTEWVPEEHHSLLDRIARWADDDVIPIRDRIDDDWDEHGIVRPLLHKLALDVGYQRAAWPEAYGGGGIDTMTTLLALEEMARA